MKAVVAYYRSGWEPKGGPSSVRRQVDEIHGHAKRQGLTLRQTYTDHADSGMTLDRPELRKLIADCHAGKIGVVLIADPERLSRDTRQLVRLLDVFHKTGVRVEFTSSAGRTRFAFLRVALSAVAELEGRVNA